MRKSHRLLALVVGATAAYQNLSAAEGPAAPGGKQVRGPFTTRQAVVLVVQRGGRLWDGTNRPLPVYGAQGKTRPGAQPRYVMPEKLPRVASIDLSESALTGHELSALQAFPHLRTLSLGENQATDESMPYVGELASLRTLRLREAALSEKGLEHLRQLTQLEELDLAWARPASFDFLAALTNLQKLDLSHAPFADKDIGHLLGLKELSSLNLEFTHLSDDGLVKLRGKRNLRELAISGPRFSERIARLVKSLPDLERVRITYSPRVDLAAARHLKDIPGITFLCFGGSDLDDEKLAHVAGLPQLKVLWIPGTRITDEGLVHLAGLPKLVELGLENNYTVTDRGLRHLAAIKSLRTLVIRNTGVSVGGIQALQRQRPKLRILHSKGMLR